MCTFSVCCRYTVAITCRCWVLVNNLIMTSAQKITLSTNDSLAFHFIVAQSCIYVIAFHCIVAQNDR